MSLSGAEHLHMPLISTRRWQKKLRPDFHVRRWQILVWLFAWAAMAGWWLFSWIEHARIHDWEDVILAWYGLTHDEAAWWQQGDVPLHVGTSFILLLLLDCGRRLIRPQWSHWSALRLTTMIAVADEGLQGLSSFRAWEWHDLASDGIGMVIGQVCILAYAHRARQTELDHQ